MLTGDKGTISAFRETPFCGARSFTRIPVINLQLVFVLAQQEAQPVQVQPSKSYLLEILIVLVIFGAALFSICRSSRRS